VLTVAALTAGSFALPPSARAAASGPAAPGVDRQARLEAMRAEIRRLEAELRDLRGRERGVLGELERLGAEYRLRDAEHREVGLRLDQVADEIAARSAQIADLGASQEERRRYLGFRLREVYKDGPERLLRPLIGGDEADRFWDGLRYAVYLNERDARVLREYRTGMVRLHEERDELRGQQESLRELEADLARTRNRLETARARRERLLAELRDDARKREDAIRELEGAADELTRLVDRLGPGESGPDVDVRKFRGLLDWPADGPVTTGFGTMVHPRFKTKVPHPGLDIDAEEGADIRAVFDGRVVFASWMRGYGLTAIVDHGGGVLSVYAHASVLLVEPEEHVIRGQTLGKVGETGSLRGPHLYFELRVDGRPADPARWLRSPKG
jgi:septal ring factor EnvC (AmiA/AmiB activator)